MTCPKVEHLCRTCKWNKKSIWDRLGNFDECKCPKNIEKPLSNVTCYVSGKSKKFEPTYRYPYSATHRSPDFISKDLCGTEGLWWEQKEKTLWDKIIEYFDLNKKM